MDSRVHNFGEQDAPIRCCVALAGLLGPRGSWPNDRKITGHGWCCPVCAILGTTVFKRARMTESSIFWAIPRFTEVVQIEHRFVIEVRQDQHSPTVHRPTSLVEDARRWVTTMIETILLKRVGNDSKIVRACTPMRRSPRADGRKKKGQQQENQQGQKCPLDPRKLRKFRRVGAQEGRKCVDSMANPRAKSPTADTNDHRPEL